MKKTLAFLLALTLALCGFAVAEEGGLFVTEDDEGLFVDEGDELATPGEPEPLEPLPTELVVGNTTKLSGNFFSDLWGNNTSDMDVRALLHGYSTVVWASQTTFEVDPTVVADVRFVDYNNGDKEYYVILNENLTYNDGTPITAADYVFTVLLSASPQISELGGAASAYKYITGYEEYRSGENDKFSGVRLHNDFMFSLRIKSEYLPFFYESSYIGVTPFPIQAIAPGCKVLDSDDGASIVTDEDNIEIDPATGAALTEFAFTTERLKDALFNPVHGYVSHPTLTSGPYTLTFYDELSGTAIFEKNDYYLGNWQGVVPTIEKITLKLAEPATMMDKLLSGEFNLLNKVTSIAVIDAGLETDFDYSTYARRGYGFLSFACETGPQSSERVRHAIAYALDQDQFILNLLGDYGLAVYGYYGIGQWMLQATTGAVTLPDLTPEQQELWDSVTLDELNTYPYDIERAAALLAEDGWTLAEDGSEYSSGVRYKLIDGELTPLTLKWAKTADNTGANVVHELLVPALESIGMNVEITELPFTELLTHYYRQTERTYDMFYLATNFNPVFDPTGTFSIGDAEQGFVNTTGLRDAELEALARDMRKTDSADVVGYYTRWFEFQKRFNSVLPTIPIYSNVYADFYVTTLQDYDPVQLSGWSEAILYAYFGYDEPDIPLIGDEDNLFIEEP